MPKLIAPDTEDEICESLKARIATRELVCARGSNSQQVVVDARDREIVVLDIQSLNQIERFEPADYYIICQAGLHLADLEEILATKRLHFPFLTPGAGGTVGGMVASGQIRAYGDHYNISRWVLALRVVMADGGTIRTGAVTYKSVAGYDLPKLFCRSFGTLGIITSAALRLYPVGSQPFGKDLSPVPHKSPRLVTLDRLAASTDRASQISQRIKREFDADGRFPALGGWNG